MSLQNFHGRIEMTQFINFNSKVIELRFSGCSKTTELIGNAGYYWNRPLLGKPVWEIAVQTNDSNCLKIFKGKILHSIDYCKLNNNAASQLHEGKMVAVVGYKKSAIELVVECVQANRGAEGKPCTMVRRGASKLMEYFLLSKLPLNKYGLKPDHPFEENITACQMVTVPETFFAEADKGNIVFKRASKWWFCEEGIEFDDNAETKADVVILATGYNGVKKLKILLPEPFRSMIGYPYGIMALYRDTIQPLISNMAFVGYVESVSNVRASKLRSMWVARLIDEKFKLPSVEIMLEQT
ncbi:putative flavin-containing monooxygenase 2 [Hibiscus syriacus]|uniref:Flavin-containing monooxygenase 2 n=1 Tax=Hibiscus syriacus TaxID=106335 RepID=A0A6A2Y1U7_HIBSY|nr:putative flavin-containing monooxygenase 2 [Hibiscus syriacus]